MNFGRSNKSCEKNQRLPERQYVSHEIEDELLAFTEICPRRAHYFGGSSRTDDAGATLAYPTRWLAIKVLENDREIMKQVEVLDNKLPLEINKSRKRIQNVIGDDAETCLVEDRYAFIRGICREACHTSTIDRISLTEKIDNVLLNRVLGIPVFLGIMWLLFQLTFTLGAPPMEWIDAGISALAEWTQANMADGLLRSLVVEGIIGGVGGVIVFLPNIILLFLGIALLEGTGYMARQLLLWIMSCTGGFT